MSKRIGKITAPSALNIQEHEMNTARAIADYGFDVEFIERVKGKRSKTADFVADGVLWEVKSPTSSNLRVIEKRLREALHQSRDVIFDARRMRHLPNDRIEREVRKWGMKLRSMRRLLYVDLKGIVHKIK